MMKLSLMKDIMETISESGESELANRLLTAWLATPETVKFFRASANVIFTFTKAQHSYVLRFNHESERSAEEICAEMTYLQYLVSVGIYIARPVRSIAGRYVESMETPIGIFHSVVFEKIVGQQPGIDDLTLDMFALWGKSLGKLHAAAQSYTGLGRPTWRQHLTECTQNIPASELAAHQVMTNLRAQLNDLPRTPDTFGLIHFDFELDNLLWTPQGITSIDFDDSAWYWFTADIAFALRDLFDDSFRKVDTSSQPFRAFIEGYQAERDISTAEIAQLPLFLMLHHVLSFAKILRALEPKSSLKEPQWAANLRQKLEKIAQSYRSEFIQYIR